MRSVRLAVLECHRIRWKRDPGLSMEGRLTLCNMTIEAGSRIGLVAPDDKTIEYVKAAHSHRPARSGTWRSAFGAVYRVMRMRFSTVKSP